jgi:hypothetical protein
MRLEGREATHPLRPHGWRLARDGGGGEVVLGIARDVRIDAVLVDPEQTAPAKVPLDAPDGALEHGADLARLQVGEPLPAQLAALLVQGAIESDQVQVRVDGASSPGGAAAPPSSTLACGSGLRSSRRSDEVLCTAVTAPVFAPRAPSRAARSA